MCVYMYMWIIGMLFTSQIDPAYPKLALLAVKFPLFLYSLSRWKVWPCASKCFEFRTESRNFLPIAKPSNPDASFPWTDLFNTDAEQSPGWIWTLCRTRAWANREPTVLLPDTKWAWSKLPKETRYEECLHPKIQISDLAGLGWVWNVTLSIGHHPSSAQQLSLGQVWWVHVHPYIQFFWWQRCHFL